MHPFISMLPAQRIREVIPALISIPDEGLTINGHLFHAHLLRDAWKRNRLIWGTCHCGKPNSPITRYKVFICARCRKMEAIYAESHKCRPHTRTPSEANADRNKREHLKSLEKYAENIYQVRGLTFAS